MTITIKMSNDMAHRVFDELRKYNDHYMPKVNYKPITFYVEEEGEFIAGLEGYIAWDMFEISNIVSVKQREGIGSELLKAAENYALDNGANKILASTLEFQAPEFYRKNGFDEYATIPNFAGNHTCHYFIKRFNQ